MGFATAPGARPLFRPGSADGEVGARLDVGELFRTLWSRKVFIAGVGLLFALGGVAYALMAQEWYRADVVLLKSEDKSKVSGLAGSLGGLASLAGINLEGSSAQEPVAVLKSRDFAREFILSNNLTDLMKNNSRFAFFDSKQTDIRRAVDYFDKKIRTVREDKRTGLVTLSVEWTSADLAAQWANALADKINEHMRMKAESDAEKNIKFIQEELAGTGVVAMQQALGRIVESEMQRLMLARGNQQYAFKVIDSATPPWKRSRPKRTMTVLAFGVLGGFLAVMWVTFRRIVRDQKSARS